MSLLPVADHQQPHMLVATFGQVAVMAQKQSGNSCSVAHRLHSIRSKSAGQDKALKVGVASIAMPVFSPTILSSSFRLPETASLGWFFGPRAFRDTKPEPEEGK